MLQDLVSRAGLFRTLIADFGFVATARDNELIGESEIAQPKDNEMAVQKDLTTAKSAVKLMLDEERETGEVKWAVYTEYIKAMGSRWWAVVIAAALILEQCATVGNSLLLGYWSNGSISGFAQGQYMAAYAGRSCLSH